MLNGDQKLRIFLVDDHEVVRSGLRFRLERHPDLSCCGEASGESQARQLLSELEPDILIVDLGLEDGDGIDLIKWAHDNLPSVQAIALTVHDEQTYGERILKAGGRGYVKKSDPLDSIIAAIRNVRAGKLFFSDKFVDRMMRICSNSNGTVREPTELLSDRELQVFSLLGSGLATSEIAIRMNLSRSTVDTYRERIKKKLALDGGSELMHRAFEWHHSR